MDKFSVYAAGIKHKTMSAHTRKNKTLTYYKVLGLGPQASRGEIQSAYRKLALRWHPDRNPDDRDRAEENMRNINEAYNHLKNPLRRSLYDRWLNKGRVNDNGAPSDLDVKPFPWAELKEMGWKDLGWSLWSAKNRGKDRDHG